MKKVVWKNSNKKVVEASPTGSKKRYCTIIAKKKGKATITAKVGKNKFICRVTVNRVKTNKDHEDKSEKSESTTHYGNITGNITYYYNAYQGHKPDTGAKVILIPTDGVAKNVDIDFFSVYSPLSSLPISTLQQYHLYIGEVDGVGNYVINHVAVGTYKVLMISKETSFGPWFDVYNEAIEDAPESYYDDIVSSYYPDLLKQETALVFGKSISFHKYNKTDVTIYKNATTTLSYDFGITYV